MKRILKWIFILIVFALVARFAMGIYVNSLIKKDNFEQSESYENITAQYKIYISDKIKTYYYYGQDTTGAFEKETSNYYYDGKIEMIHVKPLSKIIIKDLDKIENRLELWSGEVVYNTYEAIPRYFDDENSPDIETKDYIENPNCL